MLIVVSPAKSLDYESPIPARRASMPRMLDRSKELVAVMATKSPDEIRSLMSISSELAALNHERFQDWTVPYPRKRARPALFAFNGDVYMGMQARTTFGADDLSRAQKSLRILSGLYGVLRPLDLMLPYRLEMGSRLATTRGGDLYGFWGDEITDVLAADIAESPGKKVLINLASQEYFAAVRPGRLGVPVVSPAFVDAKGEGPHKIVSFFAKRARGAMAAWIIRERINRVSALSGFEGLGYHFDKARSTPERPVFARDHD